MTMGPPLIDEATAEEVVKAAQDAVSKGGKILHGGGTRRGGNYIEPTLVEVSKDVLPSLYLYKKEVFASIAAITEVNSIDEAIRLSNGRSYGLDAAIFGGEDINKIRKLMRLLEVGGAIYINDYPKHGIGYFPFGGRKDSGVGREGVGYTIESVTAYKSIVYNYKGKASGSTCNSLKHCYRHVVLIRYRANELRLISPGVLDGVRLPPRPPREEEIARPPQNPFLLVYPDPQRASQYYDRLRVFMLVQRHPAAGLHRESPHGVL